LCISGCIPLSKLLLLQEKLETLHLNAVEIEEAISTLAELPFDAEVFAYAFLSAFGNKETTIKRLRAGASNKSDLDGVLQTNHIHIKVCPNGDVTATLAALKASPATTRAKAKFILATDGIDFQAEDLNSGEVVVCEFRNFPDHFGFFLPLAGISTVRQIRESAFDIKATGRLNRLYIELLKDNPAWGTATRRPDMNHFMARLIFCFFAEDTGIFHGDGRFTATIEQMSAKDSANTHKVIGEIFRAMNTALPKRAGANLPRWADVFPYVNGGLFSGSTETPVFSKIARSYLLHIGSLDWKKINPDIFGSMIQAVADEGERSALGMHYTSVPNILKVLNPLFLDELRAQLEEAGDNARKLLNLRSRMAKIRVFDPACGSGNFLVIAYKEMRAIEAAINQRRGEVGRKTDVPKTNFRGIELRDFAAEIARLALIIAEFQCDVTYRGEVQARAEFLPLNEQNWITCGNALRLDWLSICPPTGTGVKFVAEDLFHTPLDQAQIDFENEGGETFICGNPPYLGSKWQTTEHKDDLERVFEGKVKGWRSLDYVAGWFMKAAEYGLHTPTVTALVSTNSICQGQQVPTLWPSIFSTGSYIAFAHTSFKWANLASQNAGVTVVIVGISNKPNLVRQIYSLTAEGETIAKEADNINAYLIAGKNTEVVSISKPTDERATMQFGNHTYYGVDLLISRDEVRHIEEGWPESKALFQDFLGSRETVSGLPRKCLWVSDEHKDLAWSIPPIAERFSKVAAARSKMKSDSSAQKLASTPHRFRDNFVGKHHAIVVPAISSENRPYLPVALADHSMIVGHKAYALYDAPLWNMALIASRLHLVWIGTVCVRMRTDFSYSNTLGWNTFPVPTLTEKNKADLTACAEDILLAREAHFPATIADLYDPEKMPEDLRQAHDRNDEVLERIYIGRRFRNDTERLEKLFEMYTKMTTTKNLKTTNSRMKA
jgi:hypothetical protein